jgi:hypothetical protein
MHICDCIKNLTLDECILKEELLNHDCLAIAIGEVKITDNESSQYTNNDKLILILFKAIQELKAEIDSLKSS